jgi:O-antigen ligase
VSAFGWRVLRLAPSAAGGVVGGVRLVAPWILVAAASVLGAWGVSGELETRLGRTPTLLLLALLVCGTFFVVFSFLGPSVVIVWPVAATVGYLIQLPRDHPIITFDRLWIGGMLAYIMIDRCRIERGPVTRTLLFALLWLVVSFGVRSIATEAVAGGPVAVWVNAILLPTILFVACERYCLAGRTRVQRLAAALMIAGGILGAIGVAQRIWGFELATLTGGSARFDAAVDQTRVSGPYPAPEPYALSLIICFAATLYWIQVRRRGSTYWWAIAIAGFELAGIGLSLFRAAWIAAILVIVASFGIRPGRFGRTFAVASLVAAIGLMAASQLEQNKTFGARAKNTDNIYGRLATYKQGLQIFRSAPLVGIGVGKYHGVSLQRAPVTVSNVEAVAYPHNSYIGVLAEQGVVGLLPFLFVSYAVWRLVRGLRTVSLRHEDVVLAAAFTGAVMGYLIMSLTLTMLPYEPSNTFFACFLGVASARLDSLARSAEPPSP